MFSLNLTERKEFVTQRLHQYYAAEQSVLTGQEYRMGTRSLRRANLEEIRRAIKELEAQLAALEAGQTPNAPRMVRVVPRDL